MRHIAYKTGKRVVVAVFGVTLLAIGVVMLVLPGPGVLVIAAALGVLAVEFAWARVWLAKLRRTISNVTRDQRVRGRGDK
ncbi:MAG: PGPGW domain-containing protein [Pseudomonadota bacterium]